MSRTVGIDPGARRHPIHLGAGIVGGRGLPAPHAGGRHASVVTGESVVPLSLESLRPALADASAADTHVIPGGGRYETPDTFAVIRSALIEPRTGAEVRSAPVEHRADAVIRSAPVEHRTDAVIRSAPVQRRTGAVIRSAPVERRAGRDAA